MKPSRWLQIETLYNQALELDARERTVFLSKACAGDNDLLREVEALLAEGPKAESFLEKGALREIAPEFAAATAMPWVGRRIGNYEFVSLLGAGGMGEVYRARDTKLKREVAIKLLPDEFSLDSERVSRFQREAQLLASLNHPNIAAIYDLEEEGGSRFLVLELVEGETLADRIRRGPIPVEEALKIALQIAEALEAAHEKNVIHRDLKPANVKIAPDGKSGRVKVLDFGLAKTLVGDAGVTLSNSPTVSIAATQEGVILGTAGYMSPEQARGHPVDKRADVWAFGCVLFEMLSGRQTFGGKTVSDILASVLKTKPEWDNLPAKLHPRILHLLDRCLEKEPQDRCQGLTDARVEIRKVLADSGGQQAKPSTQTQTGWRSRLSWIAAIAAAAALASILVWSFKPTAPASVVKLPFVLPEGQGLGDFVSMMTISPDGTRIAYASNGLHLRELNEAESRRIPGIDAAGQPEFSPDGQWLAFTVGSPNNSSFALKKVHVNGGNSAPLLENFRLSILQLSWTKNGTILFSSNESILEIPAAGGTPAVLIEAAVGERLCCPELLPDGESLMFSARTSPGVRGWDSAKIFVQPLKSKTRQLVWDGGADARYIKTGHIVYVQRNTLFAVPFDLDSLKRAGEPRPIIEGVQRSSIGTATGNYDVSDTGSLVYVPGTGPIAPAAALLALIDLNGGRQMLKVPPQQYRSPRLSPDRTQLSVEVAGDDDKHNIWIYSLTGAFDFRQLTQTGSNIHAIWTPDGKNLTFASNKDGTWRIYSQPADGSAVPEPLTTGEPGVEQWPESWSPDGTTLSFAKGKSGDSSLWTFSKETLTTQLFHDDKGFDDFGSAFSPDGKWLAYTVMANPAPGIRVQAFPAGQTHQVTEAGESWPVWSGNELFFRILRPELAGMDVSTKSTFGFGNRRALPLQNLRMFGFDRRDYDTRDGKNFVVILPVPVAPPAAAATPAPRPRSQINIVLNWFEELKTLMAPR